MRSTRRPSLERTLVWVLAGFIAVDLLLIVPAYASELRLDRLHPSLPIVNLRPLAAGRARITDGLGGKFTAPVQAIAGDLQQAGAKALSAILYEEDAVPGNPSEPTEAITAPNSDGAGIALMSSATPSPSPDDTSTAGPSSLTADSIETSVVQTATSLAQPPETNNPTATSTQISSYTPTSTSVQSQQTPTMKPSQAAALTATVICATVTATACQPTSTPTSTPTAIPTLAPSPTHTQTAIPAPTHSGPIPAFPGAEGHGAGSVGGRGGRIIEVTNLNDSGPGSLRAAIEATGPRIVVFRIAGLIRLESALRLTQPYITIAGQTAPGGGITLVDERLIVSTHSVIIRYLRWRGGHNSFLTLRSWNDLHDVIIDHCSASWGENDIIDIWFGPDAKPDMRNITIQNCLIAEPLAVHPTGMISGAEWTESLDYIEQLHHISVHHNLFAHAEYRNPRIKAQYTEVINNVVYNWGNRIGGSARASEVDWIGNYFKAGPMTENDGNSYLRHESVDYYDWGIVYPGASLYLAGNVAPERGYPDADADNWWMYTEYAGPNGGETIPEVHRRNYPLDSAPFPVTIQSAYGAYSSVVSNTGANARLDSLGNWISNYDVIDLRFLSDVQNGTGPSSYLQIGGPGQIGSINSGTPYDDSDHDGMADQWELLYCFDPNDLDDGPGDADGDGYTNVEEFLNGTPPTSAGHC